METTGTPRRSTHAHTHSLRRLAYNFHDDENEHLGRINVNGGSDAISAFWHDLSSDTPLYASHADFVRQVAHNHSAHW